MNAVINFYKPPGMSSAQAVGFIKALTGDKVGHAGTLDPEAAGVLPILIGKGTKICDYLMDSDKQYLAEVAFGQATDTQDAQGQVIATSANYPDINAVKSAVQNFIGEVMQLPPQYSALKIQGKSAYQLAREGKVAKLKERPVRFDSIQVLGETANHGFLLRVRCGKGAYIRTLCHDLGQVLGCASHMRFLLREESAGLAIMDAVTPQDLRDWKEGKGTDQNLFMDLASLLQHFPFYEIPGALRFQALNGVVLPADKLEVLETEEDTKVCLTMDGQLHGIYALKDGLLRVRVMLTER